MDPWRPARAAGRGNPAGVAAVAPGGRGRGGVVVDLAGAGVLFGAGGALDRWYRRPIAVVESNTSLRLSPHELAPAVGEVPALGAVRPEGRRGSWLRVTAPGGELGWIRQEDVALVSRPGAS